MGEGVINVIGVCGDTHHIVGGSGMHVFDVGLDF